MMSQRTDREKDIIFLILQFLEKNKFCETARMLEQESNLFFNLKYFEELVLSGKWEEAEGYLLRFTDLKSNRYSTKMLFEMRKQKYLEALDNSDRVKALDILMTGLKEFFSDDDHVFRGLTLLLSVNDFRQNELFSTYTDAKSARTNLMTKLKNLIAVNCLLREKVKFPSIPPSRSMHLLQQRLDWQLKYCTSTDLHLGMTTLHLGHVCQQLDDRRSQQVRSNKLIGTEGYIPVGTNLSSQCVPVSVQTPCTMENHPPDTKKMHLSDLAKQGSHKKAATLGGHGDKNSRKRLRMSPNKGRLEPIEKEGIISKIWKPTYIVDPTRLQSLRLPLSMKADKILRLKYSSSGSDILALSSSAIILVWKWQQHDEPKAKAKATTKMVPRLKQVKSGIIMTNDLPKSKPEESLPCMVVSNNDSYAVSASGGRVSLFNLVTFETLTTFMPPQPTVTCLALHPLDNNMVAAGMDDSTLHIFEASLNEVTNKLKGHSGRITGLAFSHWLKSLISSGADAQIIVWNFFSWKIQRNTFLKTSDGKAPAEPLDTHVEFHKDERHFLAVNRTQLAIYDGQNLQCRKQWFVRDYWAPISHAAFSGDSQSVYAAFLDGNVFIFHAPSLRVQYRIGPAAYMPSCISSKPYPLVIAPNPQEPNQFSIGLSEGGVVVLEPLESEGQWGVRVPAVDNPLSIATISGSGSDSDSGSCSDQG